MLDKIVVLLIVAVVLVHTVVSTAAVDSVAKTNEDFIIVIGNNTDVIDIPITILPPDEENIDQLEWLLFQYFDNDLCLENQQLYMQGIRQGTCFHDKSLVNIQSFQHDASVTSYRFTFPPDGVCEDVQLHVYSDTDCTTSVTTTKLSDYLTQSTNVTMSNCSNSNSLVKPYSKFYLLTCKTVSYRAILNEVENFVERVEVNTTAADCPIDPTSSSYYNWQRGDNCIKLSDHESKKVVCSISGGSVMHYYNTTSNCQGPQVLSPYEPGVCSANLNYGDGNDLSLPLENNSSFSEEERFDVNYKFCYVSLRFYGIPTPPPFISITFTDDKNVTTPFHMKFQFNITDINSPDVVHEADVKTGIRKLLCDTFQLPISRCTCEGDCLVVGYSQANSDSILQSTSLQLGVSINVLFDAADYLQYPDEDALTTFLGSKYNTAMTTFNILLQEFYINIITRYSQYFSTTSFFTNLTYRQFSIINYTLQPSLLPTLQPKISNRNNSMISSGTIAGVVIAVVLMIFIIISMYLYYSHIGKHLSSLSNFVGSNVNNSVAPDVEACTPSGHA